MTGSEIQPHLSNVGLVELVGLVRLGADPAEGAAFDGEARSVGRHGDGELGGMLMRMLVRMFPLANPRPVSLEISECPGLPSTDASRTSMLHNK